MGDFSGNAEGVDWQDIAMAGRAYADNLVGEPGISRVMHLMADEIEKLRSLTRFQDRVIRSGDTAVLTTAEREAVEWALKEAVWSYSTDCGGHRDALRGLLERLSKGTPEQRNHA